jgi:tricorn protease
MQGNVLENRQLNPDIEVYNDPADELAGRDAQLEAAVKALLEK